MVKQRTWVIGILSCGLAVGTACGSDDGDGGGGSGTGGSGGGSSGSGGSGGSGGSSGNGGSTGGSSGAATGGNAGSGGGAGGSVDGGGGTGADDGGSSDAGPCGPLSGGDTDCDKCQAASCCSELEACATSNNCTNFLGCLQSGKDMTTCTTEVGAPGAEFTAFGTCVQTNCQAQCID